MLGLNYCATAWLINKPMPGNQIIFWGWTAVIGSHESLEGCLEEVGCDNRELPLRSHNLYAVSSDEDKEHNRHRRSPGGPEQEEEDRHPVIPGRKDIIDGVPSTSNINASREITVGTHLGQCQVGVLTQIVQHMLLTGLKFMDNMNGHIRRYWKNGD